VNQMIAAVLKGHSQQDVGGRLFVGDLRSLRYLPHFHSSVEAFRLMAMSDASDQRGATPSEQLRSAVEVASLDEKELCVDPIFFTTLGEEIKHAYTRILVKRGVAINELTKYRYDTILFIGETALPPTADPSDIVEYRWSSLGGSGSLASLAQTLGEYTSTTKRFVVVRSVPNVQLVSDHALVALLASKTKLSVEEMVAASTEHGESAKRAASPDDRGDSARGGDAFPSSSELSSSPLVAWVSLSSPSSIATSVVAVAAARGLSGDVAMRLASQPRESPSSPVSSYGLKSAPRPSAPSSASRRT
jgi:hypothetical protein